MQKALQSNAPVTALEAVVHDHPDLPEAIGKSWADGFGTDQIPPPIARFLVDRGAKLSVHAAAGFGFTDSLADLFRGDPMLVNAKGGDGCTPLHFARDVATAQLLLRIGARTSTLEHEDHRSPLPLNGASARLLKFRGSFSIAERLPTSSLLLP